MGDAIIRIYESSPSTLLTRLFSRARVCLAWGSLCLGHLLLLLEPADFEEGRSRARFLPSARRRRGTPHLN